MAYESFTLETLKAQFGLTCTQASGAYDNIAPLEPGALLYSLLERYVPLVTDNVSDKARAERLTAPILVEARTLLHNQTMLFSGVRFDVDKKAGITGCPDFLITRQPFVDWTVEPILAVGEAIQRDLDKAITKCVAVIVAIERYNRDRKPLSPIYGTVTDGTRWRFLQLENTVVQIDIKEYTLSELPQILGILTHMAS